MAYYSKIVQMIKMVSYSGNLSLKKTFYTCLYMFYNIRPNNGILQHISQNDGTLQVIRPNNGILHLIRPNNNILQQNRPNDGILQHMRPNITAAHVASTLMYSTLSQIMAYYLIFKKKLCYFNLVIMGHCKVCDD